MSESGPNPVPYRVVYSERVRMGLKGLLAQAKAGGYSQEVAFAAKTIDARLRVYPQFGEPLRVFESVAETLYVGTVPPLVVQYAIDEERRLVLVVTPFKLLPKSGF